MKVNIKSKAATAPKATIATATATAKAKPTTATKISLPDKLKWLPAVAILTGARGILAREVVTATDKKTGRVFVKAVKNELGLSLKEASVGEIIKGELTGDKVARVQLGGYVNGRNTGAKVSLTNLAAFVAKSRKCVVHWNIDDNGIAGHYIGNPNQKGMCAVYVPEHKFVWQMEMDSNANNRHERGKLLPVNDKTPLVSVAP